MTYLHRYKVFGMTWRAISKFQEVRLFNMQSKVVTRSPNELWIGVALSEKNIWLDGTLSHQLKVGTAERSTALHCTEQHAPCLPKSPSLSSIILILIHIISLNG